MDWTFAWLMALPLLLLAVAGLLMGRPPGRASAEPLPTDETGLQRRLEDHVRFLAGRIGERNLWHIEALTAAAGYIETQLQAAGYAVRSQEYVVEGKRVRNLEVEIPGSGRADLIVVVGAHYDSVAGSPGANDNASGVAALLEIARLLRETKPAQTVRLVAFVNEEPPFFQTEAMGSRVYARRARERGENIVAMLSLETIGYFSQAEGSQAFPLSLLRLFYPDRGNFVAFVGNLGSRRLLLDTLAAFRRHTPFPAEGLAAPAWVPGVDWSDQWSFWEEGYPAIMLTDTAVFRYPYYHTAADTPEKLDYPSLARVTAGLAAAVAELLEGSAPGKGN